MIHARGNIRKLAWQGLEGPWPSCKMQWLPVIWSEPKKETSPYM